MTKDILSRTLLCPNCRPHARRTEASKPAAMIVPNTCWMMVIMMMMVFLVIIIIIMKVVIMMLLLMMMAMKVTNDGGDDHDAHNDRYCDDDDDDDGNDDNDICFIQSNMTYINVITSLICPIVEEPFLYLSEIHFNVFLDFTTRSSATDAG